MRTCTFERVLSEDHEVEDHSNRPDIGLVAIGQPSKNFRRHEERGAAGSTSDVIDFLGKSEVSNFAAIARAVFVFLEENVLTFYIAVNYIVTMDGLNSIEQL